MMALMAIGSMALCATILLLQEYRSSPEVLALKERVARLRRFVSGPDQG
jgi:hypothetical protein